LAVKLVVVKVYTNNRPFIRYAINKRRIFLYLFIWRNRYCYL